MTINLTVIKFNKDNLSCSAKTSNDILIVFKIPENLVVTIGDKIQIFDFKMESMNTLTHQASNTEFELMINANDVHDLRLPVTHGRSRTPSKERLIQE